MALQWISAGWKTHLKTVSPVTDRVYIDFRQVDYPSIAGTPTYTALTSGTQWSGYSNLTGGYAAYLLDMPTKWVLDIRAVANFAFDTADDQPLASWYVGANTYFTILYRAADDKIVAKWKGSANERELVSAALDGTTLPAVKRITVSFDSTTGDTTGGALYLDSTAVDTAWSGAVDARSIRLPKLEIRAENTTVGAWNVNTVRYFGGITATAAQVANSFKDIQDEEVVWYFNSCSLGHTRCNVTSFVRSAYRDASVEDPDTGSLVGDRLSVSLYSRVGEFADDQYAAFDPANNVYNGTSAQAYMKQRCRVLMETWYGDDFEPLFVGRVEDGFRRGTPVGGISMVDIGAVDQTGDLAMRRLRRGRFYQDYELTSATEAESLVHTIVRLGTQREIYNYLANSSFENATIANSWTASGGTLTRQADPLMGSNSGRLVNAAGVEHTVTQIVTFTGAKALNVGEKWTFSVWMKSAGAAANNISLQERDSGGTNGTTTAAYSLAGGEGWVRTDVSRTITDTDSDRLAVQIEVADGVTLYFDAAMLTQSSRAYEWFVLNNNDGASGEESADDADYSTYDTHGFDVDVVTITHPWLRLSAGDAPWDAVKMLAQACLAYQCGFLQSGVFAFKAVLGDTYSDPAADETISTAQDIMAEPVAERANRVIARGDKITIATALRIMWTASESGAFAVDETGRMSQTIVNGATWPPSATFGEFVARYDAEGGQRLGDFGGGGSGKGGSGLPGSGAYGTGRRKEGAEVIGLVDAELRQSGIGGALTTTTLDTTKYADGAVLLLTNATGSDVTLRDLGLIGKPVVRCSGRSGFVHDAFVDWERVEREGEHTLEIGNQFVVTKTQVEKLADWHWKYNSGSVKHTYVFQQAGTWHWLVPGRTYTLAIGGAGQKEYISATARLMSVSTERGASELGTTRLVFRELLQSWTFDSNAVARYLAGQDYARRRGVREVLVAASNYVGQADYFCDGTADQTEINAAIDAISSAVGGVVRLTEGPFTLSATIVLKSYVTLAAAGPQATTLAPSANDFAMITATGTDTTRDLVGAGVRDLGFDGDYANYTYVRAIYADDTAGLRIENIQANDCSSNSADPQGIIHVIESAGCIIRGVSFDGGGYYGMPIRMHTVAASLISGITITGTWDNGLIGLYPAITTGLTVSDVSIADAVVGALFSGILIGVGTGCTVTGCEIKNVLAMTKTVSTLAMYCIHVAADDSVVDANTVSDVSNFHSSVPVGIYNSGDRNHIQNNTCRNVGNLILNGNCEDDTPVPYLTGETDDYNANCTFARSSDFAHRGTYSYKFTKTIAAGTGAASYFHNHDAVADADMGGLVGGCTYTMQAWVYIPTASGILGSEIFIRMDDDTQTPQTGTAANTYDEWQQVTLTITLGAAATGIVCFVGADSAAANNEYFYVDDIEVIPVGVHNEHGTAFDEDTVTGTRIADNSWSLPFVG